MKPSTRDEYSPSLARIFKNNEALAQSKIDRNYGTLPAQALQLCKDFPVADDIHEYDHDEDREEDEKPRFSRQTGDHHQSKLLERFPSHSNDYARERDETQILHNESTSKIHRVDPSNCEIDKDTEDGYSASRLMMMKSLTLTRKQLMQCFRHLQKVLRDLMMQNRETRMYIADALPQHRLLQNAMKNLAENELKIVRMSQLDPHVIWQTIEKMPLPNESNREVLESSSDEDNAPTLPRHEDGEQYPISREANAKPSRQLLTTTGMKKTLDSAYMKQRLQYFHDLAVGDELPHSSPGHSGRGCLFLRNRKHFDIEKPFES